MAHYLQQVYENPNLDFIKIATFRNLKKKC